MITGIDIGEWQLVCASGEWFVGVRASPTSRKLERLQKCFMQFGMIENKQGLPRPKTAVLTYPWFLEEMIVPEGALWLSISSFFNPKEWVPVIESTERLKVTERAERAGLIVAGAH
jgi:hypothetical protein